MSLGILALSKSDFQSSGGKRSREVGRLLWACSLISSIALPSARMLIRLLFIAPNSIPLACTLDMAAIICQIQGSLTVHGIVLDLLLARLINNLKFVMAAT